MNRAFTFAAAATLTLGAGTPAHLTAGGNVTKIEMITRPKSYTGPCPAPLRFTGVIHVSQSPVTVEYQWERSDGATAPKHKIVIRNRGLGVNDSWKVGGAGEHLTVWEKLHVLSPNDMVSPAGSVVVKCR